MRVCGRDQVGEAIMAGIRAWFCNPDAEPDFKQIVEKSLALFGVFTGATLSFYVKDFLLADKDLAGFNDFSLWARACLVATVIALFLRYIVGSASHLHATYVPKVTMSHKVIFAKDAAGNPIAELVSSERRELASSSLNWLFFDIGMLVLFGIVAVFIIQASNLEEFMWFSSGFVLVGFAWGVVAFFCRPPRDAEFAKRWLAIDIVQIAITLVLIYALRQRWVGSVGAPTILAAVYVFCLFLDFAMISRPPVISRRERNPPSVEEAGSGLASLRVTPPAS
jgi:hypothetical protein